MDSFTVAACQLDSRADREKNVEEALSAIDRAVAAGADLVSLPELFTFLGPKDEILENAESIPGPTVDRLAERAREHGVWIHAGSMYERATDGPAGDAERAYNTTVLLDDAGEIVATYRKLHLFDVEIGERVSVLESERVAPGDDVTVVETPFGTLGLAVCYDLRFPELFTALSRRGADVLFLPAAFTLQTGKDHWEPLLRARAIENQAYVVAAGQVGRKPNGVTTYGNSMIVDPWGTVVSRIGERSGVITAEIDLEYLERVRRELPSLSHRRSDVY